MDKNVLQTKTTEMVGSMYATKCVIKIMVK